MTRTLGNMRHTIIVCRVDQRPVIEKLTGGTEQLVAMQKIVGGYIECVRLSHDPSGRGIDLSCDEEFLLKDYRPNRLINHKLVIHGDFFIAAHDHEGDTVGLTPEEILLWLEIATGWPQVVAATRAP